MENNLENKQLNYLLSLSKKNPRELFYLLHLNYPPIAFKRDEFLNSKNFLSSKNGVLSILDLKGESRHMDSYQVYMEEDSTINHGIYKRI